ncbi:M20 family metallopeptidase [Lentibacillus sp. CBA3610]|uniref:M20 family metallopeptidase n=1 Tax=Lentibacillus sp. CBA3610 TaxID=2518176 RepID=UPI0020D1F5A6|nr:M20 family metallopeptidase [Lentibacillus sp. CBA3610]
MEILNYLNKNQRAIVKDIEDVVIHDSPSLHKEMVDECGQYLKQLISERLGSVSKEYPNRDVGNHLKFDFGEGAEQILILTHYDTVWEKGTLSFQIEGSRAYGPGIHDMKGGIIQGIWALKAIKDLQLSTNKKIAFLLTADEELFSPTSRELIEKEAKKSAAVLVLEPPNAKTGALKIARKGAAKFKMSVKGISSHAGNNPDVNASAIHEIAHQIRILEGFSDLDQGTTVNVGVVKGGTMSNVVSDNAEAEIDVRFFTKSEGERIEQEILNLQPKFSKTRVQIEGGINRPPMEGNEESARLFELASKSANELGFNITGESVGGISDGNLTAAIGVATLDGLGSVGEGPHAFHEHIKIDEIPNRTALLARLLLKL